MPLYTYKCPDCKQESDRFYRVKDFPQVVKCVACGGKAGKIITIGHGGIQTDNDVPWLPSAVQVLQPDHERPLQTREEYKRYLKERGIQPAG